MTVGEVPDAADTRWLRWHHERTPIVCPPTLLPSLSPSPEQSRSAPPGRSAAQGTGRLVVAKARGAFWHQLGAGREAGAERVMASFSGFAFQSLIHFRIFSGWGVRIEEGASAAGRFHRARPGQRTGLRPPPARRGLPSVRLGVRGSGAAPALRPLSGSACVGGWHFAGSGSFRRARAAGLLFAPGRSPACRPQSARTPGQGAERGEPEGYPRSWRAAGARAGFEVHKLKAKQT